MLISQMESNGKLSAVDRRHLSASLRQHAEQGEEPVLDDPERFLQEYRPASDLLEVIDRIVKHIGAKAPGGNRYVPLIGHRDYGIAGAEEPEGFDHALAEAENLGYVQRQALSEAAYRLRPPGWERLRILRAQANAVRSIFLSHAAVDRTLAELMRSELARLRPDTKVFVASRPGDIRADEDWLPVIQRELRAADAYCVLLTPHSTGRPWVWFETGAAWMSNKCLVIALAAGMSASDVPLPLATRQTYSLEDPEGAKEVFRALDADLQDQADFAATMRRLGRGAAEAARSEAGWQGIDLNGTYYAWDGPLSGLPDYDAEPEPDGMVDALRGRGLVPRWTRPENVSTHRTRGKGQVFATDRLTYRRAIINGRDLVLIVGS